VQRPEGHGPAPGVLGARQSPWKHAPRLLGTVEADLSILPKVSSLSGISDGVHPYRTSKRERPHFLGVHLILNSAKGNTSGQGSPVS
jgi:hypothetical protein